MPKLPRDLDANDLIKILSHLNYNDIRQKGSHIRLTSNTTNKSITIPNHSPLKVGTLNAIMNDVCLQTGKSKNEILNLINRLI